METGVFRKQVVRALGANYNPKRGEIVSIERLVEKCKRLERKIDKAKDNAEFLSDKVDNVLNKLGVK